MSRPKDNTMNTARTIMAMESSDSPRELRERVTSPGGTTERALEILESGGIRALVSRAERAGQKPSAVLVPVTPEVVRQLGQAEAARAALAPDPLADGARRYEYRVAPHDVLNVIVWEHPEPPRRLRVSILSDVSWIRESQRNHHSNREWRP